jgi:ribosome-associated translation inhibitor RaiA
MRTPLQISFHQMAPSPDLDAEVRRWVDELESIFDRIVSCHVVVEAPHRHHQGGLYAIRVELQVPGAHIVAGRSPAEHAAHTDIHVAIKDAFRAVRRQLEEHIRRARGDVKSHAAG